MHTVIDHNGYLTEVVTVTEAKYHEVNIAKLLKLPKGSIVVFDRGYNDYTWYRQFCKSDGSWSHGSGNGVTSDHIIQITICEKTMTLRCGGYRD
ncbi:hypothetical protein [Solidesulfovibrio alcoholivorans]|uniref:hypothetical protein n=1 Tax=Solidesulfovibrio alcoholivorans TaxID=81406 RepID=UPI0006931FBD|nr:hypothetical protein [Solidesulfovibrio alcoholivorans]